MREKESMRQKLKAWWERHINRKVEEMPTECFECNLADWQCGVCNRGECYGLTEKCDSWEYRNAQSS